MNVLGRNYATGSIQQGVAESESRDAETLRGEEGNIRLLREGEQVRAGKEQRRESKFDLQQGGEIHTEEKKKKEVIPTKDPPIRADKRCARAGCKEKLPEIALKNNDPFCSTDCCRKYYHVKFPAIGATSG